MTAVVNAADYGVPQHRRRAIVVARRDGGTFAWPPKTHVERPVRAWDAIGSLHLRPSELPETRGAWADLLPSIPEGHNYLWHTDRGGGRPLFGYRRRFWSFLLKLSKHQPSWTLSAQPGPSTGPFHWESRPLAVREILRLQSFPANVEGRRQLSPTSSPSRQRHAARSSPRCSPEPSSSSCAARARTLLLATASRGNDVSLKQSRFYLSQPGSGSLRASTPRTPEPGSDLGLADLAASPSSRPSSTGAMSS